MINTLGAFNINVPNTIINQSTSTPDATIRVLIYGMDEVLVPFNVTVTTRQHTGTWNPPEVFSCDKYSSNLSFTSQYKNCSVMTIESDYSGAGSGNGIVLEHIDDGNDQTIYTEKFFTGHPTTSEQVDLIRKVRQSFSEVPFMFKYSDGHVSDIATVLVFGYSGGGDKIIETLSLKNNEITVTVSDFYVVTGVSYLLESGSLGSGVIEFYSDQILDNVTSITNEYTADLFTISNHGAQAIGASYNPADVVIISLEERDDTTIGTFTIDVTTDLGTQTYKIQNMFDGESAIILNGISTLDNVRVNDYLGAEGTINIGKIAQSAPPANNPPEIVSQIPDVTYLNTSGNMFDLSSYFSDPDNDTLTYSAVENGQVSLPSFMNISGDLFNVTPGGIVGSYDIDVTANDGNGGAVTQSFTITIEDGNPPSSENVGKWIKQISTNCYALIMQETDGSYNCVEWLEIQNPINIDYFRFAKHFIYQSGLSVNISKSLIDDNSDYEIVDLNQI